jgi:hypothetical protein
LNEIIIKDQIIDLLNAIKNIKNYEEIIEVVKGIYYEYNKKANFYDLIIQYMKSKDNMKEKIKLKNELFVEIIMYLQSEKNEVNYIEKIEIININFEEVKKTNKKKDVKIFEKNKMYKEIIYLYNIYKNEYIIPLKALILNKESEKLILENVKDLIFNKYFNKTIKQKIIKFITGNKNC